MVKESHFTFLKIFFNKHFTIVDQVEIKISPQTNIASVDSTTAYVLSPPLSASFPNRIVNLLPTAKETNSFCECEHISIYSDRPQQEIVDKTDFMLTAIFTHISVCSPFFSPCLSTLISDLFVWIFDLFPGPNVYRHHISFRFTNFILRITNIGFSNLIIQGRWWRWSFWWFLFVSKENSYCSLFILVNVYFRPFAPLWKHTVAKHS